MKIRSALVWTFTILAFAFLFFSLRSETNGMLYSLIALGLWAVAFLLNRIKGSTNEEKEEA